MELLRPSVTPVESISQAWRLIASNMLGDRSLMLMSASMADHPALPNADVPLVAKDRATLDV